MKNRSEKEVRKIRLQFIGGTVLFLLTLLIVRVFFIQIIEGSQYKELTMRQHQYKINHMSSRGTIYDRNMVPLTNVENTVVLFVDSSMMDENVIHSMKNLAEEDSEILGENSGTRYKILKVRDSNKEVMSNLFDNFFMYPLQMYKRYYHKQPAAHLIGYVNQWDNTGVSGLEKSFEEILNRSKPEIYATVDGVNNIIPGLGFEVKNMEQNGSIITTIDIDLQKKLEIIFENYQKKGCAIVLEASSGDILACANFPSYNPNDISEHLASQNDELFNRAIQVGYPPGSIFKIIVAASALETGVINEDTSFMCNGYEEINGVRIKCSAYEKGGHGILTLKEAFSKSCNSAFIQLGLMTGGDNILEMSRKFGLGKKTGIPIDEENAGNLPSVDEVQGAGIGNLSVGQGELLITPLQAARITAIIANRGIDHGVHLVKSIMDKSGISKDIYEKNCIRIISRNSAKKISDMMDETVQTGTANNLGKIYSWEAAGKTGSAQSSYRNIEVVHAWFTGYIPSNDPQYIITVFIEDGKSGRQAAIPVFKEISEYLYEREHRER